MWSVSLLVLWYLNQYIYKIYLNSTYDRFIKAIRILEKNHSNQFVEQIIQQIRNPYSL